MRTVTTDRTIGIVSMQCIGAQIRSMKLARTFARLGFATAVLRGVASPSATTLADSRGAMPWQGVDAMVVGAQIVLALQTIESSKA
jgi:hypothetical protein